MGSSLAQRNLLVLATSRLTFDFYQSIVDAGRGGVMKLKAQFSMTEAPIA